MKRGEVWWAELAGDAGFRPVAVVSRSDGLERRSNVTIAELPAEKRFALDQTLRHSLDLAL